MLIDALSKLEYRGYDSAGIAVFDNGEIKVAKSKGRLKDLENKIDVYKRQVLYGAFLFMCICL